MIADKGGQFSTVLLVRVCGRYFATLEHRLFKIAWGEFRDAAYCQHIDLSRGPVLVVVSSRGLGLDLRGADQIRRKTVGLTAKGSEGQKNKRDRRGVCADLS